MLTTQNRPNQASISTSAWRLLIAVVFAHSLAAAPVSAAPGANDAVFVAVFSDLDSDGIGDYIENALLAKYSPYYLFSEDWAAGGIFFGELYNPTDVYWYLQQSELLPSGDENDTAIIDNAVLSSKPEALLFPLSDITSFSWRSSYYVNPLEEVNNVCGNPGRHGRDWDYILARRNVGLYGHVVRASQAYRSGEIQRDDGTDGYYKIEYWQFFGYSSAHRVANIGDHEGDWTTVQVLYDPRLDSVVKVFHYAHGNEMVFDMATASAKLTTTATWGRYEEYQGSNYGKTFDDAGEIASNNAVRFYQDPNTNQYTHPVVYIENGSHEFWPTEKGVFYVYQLGVAIGNAPPHGGTDVAHRYLTQSIPNLGEVEAETIATSEAEIVLRYNGSWGAFSRLNSPPPGPPLHTEWTWPANSVIRPKLTVERCVTETCLEH
jgi:hypothetical protein